MANVYDRITRDGVTKLLADGVNLVSSAETSTTAACAHAKGSFFTLLGVLFRATADIAAGGSISESNCERAYVMDQVPALDESLSETGKAADAGKVGEALAEKADANGSYDTLAAGVASQLASQKRLTDRAPYTHRAAPEGVGSREYLKRVIGASVGWNQLCRNGNFANGTENWSIVDATASVVNGIATIVPTNATSTMRSVFSRILNHKHLIMCQMKGNGDGGIAIWGGSLVSQAVSLDNTWKTVATVVNNSSTDSSYRVDYTCRNNSELAEWQLKNCVNFDLTQMFGSTIADYIYSLETATAGAGIAWFCKLFPAPYYAYDTGTILSVNTSAHKTVGFNQWDEETADGYWTDNGANSESTYLRCKNLVRLIPDNAYYLNFPQGINVYEKYYDQNGNAITAPTKVNRVFTAPNNCYYYGFAIKKSDYGNTYKHDICINLHWDGERDGDYEPYVEHVYPLDSDLTLRGILRLDGDSLYADGDTYAPNGAVSRKYAQVSLDGTEDWKMLSAGKYYLENSTPGCVLYVNQSDPANSYKAASNLYPFTKIVTQSNQVTGDKSFYIQSNDNFKRVWIYDSAITTLEAFTAALSAKPLTVVYRLATPTAETADAYDERQTVGPGGTEEFTDARTVAVPVGHETEYETDLRGKLEKLPAIPAAPSTDGTYSLQCTVTGGVAAFSWVSE